MKRQTILFIFLSHTSLSLFFINFALVCFVMHSFFYSFNQTSTHPPTNAHTQFEQISDYLQHSSFPSFIFFVFIRCSLCSLSFLAIDAQIFFHLLLLSCFFFNHCLLHLVSWYIKDNVANILIQTRIRQVALQIKQERQSVCRNQTLNLKTFCCLDLHKQKFLKNSKKLLMI